MDSLRDSAIQTSIFAFCRVILEHASTAGYALAFGAGPQCHTAVILTSLIHWRAMNPQFQPLFPALRACLFSSAMVFACMAPAVPALAGTSIISIGAYKTFNSDIDMPGGSLHIAIDGDFAFAQSEDDVISISKKALFEERHGEHVYRIVFEHGQGGMARTYTIDGKPHAWDAEGKRWLGTVIPRLLRETGYESEARSKRIYAAGGADALLTEIELIQSGFSRRKYIVELAGFGQLDEKQLVRVLAAIDKIESDFDRRNAYVALIERQSLGNTAQAGLLQGAAAIHSDFELRTVLVALTPKLGSDDAVGQGWLAAMHQIHSDFEARTAVVALADADGKTASRVDLALQSTQNINSAFERRTALTQISRNMAHPSDAQVAAYARSASRIDSDFERRTAIVALADKATLGKNGCLELLGAFDGMHSDFEIRTALVEVARRLPKDEEVIARYRSIARKLGDFERIQAEKALDHLG